MDVSHQSSLLTKAAFATALLSLAVASGCRSPFLVSQRCVEPTCEAVIGEAPEFYDDQRAPGIPVMVWPQVAWPACLQRDRLHARQQALREDFNDFLQPQPPAPLKPPHSRFHPLPTQPAFAQRAEYRSPELLGVDPLAPHAAPLLPGDLPEVEAIPIPTPDEPTEPTWQDLPRTNPLRPAPQGEALPRPVPAPPPAMLRPAAPPSDNSDDASRGPVAPSASNSTTSAPKLVRPMLRSELL